MANSVRVKRLAGQVKQQVALILQSKFHDPKMGLITVTAVRVSKDVSYADLYVTFLVPHSQDRSVEANQVRLNILQKASGSIRSELGQMMQIRSVPQLRFHFDELSVSGPKMESLIKEAREKDQSTDGDTL